MSGMIVKDDVMVWAREKNSRLVTSGNAFLVLPRLQKRVAADYSSIQITSFTFS